MIALPSRSCPDGDSTAAADARVNVRAAIASVPSAAASAITSASEKLSTVAARATKTARLADVQSREHGTGADHLEPGDDALRDQGGHELHAQEQPGGGERAAGLVVDQDGQRDLPDPVPQLVDRVGGGELREAAQAQW